MTTADVLTDDKRRTLLLAAARASGLADRYAGDEALLELHIRKQLKPGWAGSVDAVERDYIRRAKVALGTYVPVPPREHAFGEKQPSPPCQGRRRAL